MDITDILVNACKLSNQVCRLNSSEIIVRCPFCGDSRKSQSHSHFYISKTPPYPFFCQRCSETGILNRYILELLGVMLTPDLIKLLKVAKANMSSDTSNTTVYGKYHVYHDFVYTDTEKIKLRNDYISYRFNKDMVPFLKRHNYNIIYDLKHFLNMNKRLLPIFKNQQTVDLLDNAYIGFIANNKFIFRAMFDMQYRFIILPIPNLLKSYFNVKQDIDLTRTYSFVVTEGIFDLIGVHSKYYEDSSDKIMVSTGNIYLLNYLHFVHASGFPQRHLVEFYLQNDGYDDGKLVATNEFQYIMDALTPLKVRAKFYVNKAGSDYGRCGTTNGKTSNIKRQLIMDTSHNV